MSGTNTKTLNLRELVPGLPKTLTAESLEAMTPEQQATLLRNLDQGITNIDRKVTEAKTIITQRKEEMARINRDIEAEFGATTPEELDSQIAANTATSIELWQAVEQLLEAA